MSSRSHIQAFDARPARPVLAASTGATRVAGLLLFIEAAWFLTAIMLGASMVVGYSYANGAISDLGVLPGTALLFNVSLALVGVLNVVAGYLWFRSHGRAWVLAIFALGSVGALGAAAFPLDRGDVHSLFALGAFVFFNLEALAVATIVRGPLRAVSVLAGLVGLVFVVLMLIGDGGDPGAFGPINHGGAERMIVYPVMLWMMGLGGYLLGRGDADRDA